MGNAFDRYEKEQERRKIAQRSIEETAKRKSKRQPRTTICLSISEEDKKKIQKYALEQDVTVATIIHGWIAEHIG